MMKVAWVVGLVMVACGGEPFERGLFADGGGDAGQVEASDPCAACQCAAAMEACVGNPANNCQGVGELLPSCCECPVECSLKGAGCVYFPVTEQRLTDQWCCPS